MIAPHAIDSEVRGNELIIWGDKSFSYYNDAVTTPLVYGPTSANVPPIMWIPQRHDSYGNRVFGTARMVNDNDAEANVSLLQGASMITPLVLTTQIEKEVKELKEIVLKFMNKDGLNLQALNFQDLTILPHKFRMPEIKRFKGIGCPISHLKSYTLAVKSRWAMPQIMAANF